MIPICMLMLWIEWRSLQVIAHLLWLFVVGWIRNSILFIYHCFVHWLHPLVVIGLVSHMSKVIVVDVVLNLMIWVIYGLVVAPIVTVIAGIRVWIVIVLLIVRIIVILILFR